jgi:hypothetical protein
LPAIVILAAQRWENSPQRSKAKSPQPRNILGKERFKHLIPQVHFYRLFATYRASEDSNNQQGGFNARSQEKPAKSNTRAPLPV